MAKLLTSREDRNHYHALFGVANLIVYIIRLIMVVAGVPNGGFGRNLLLDIVCLCLMLMPNLSSFIFHVPVPNKKDSVTIWAEFRLHSLIFVVQGVLFLGLKCYELHFRPIEHLFAIKCAIIGCRFVAMWAATRFCPPGSQTTIRGMYKERTPVLAFFMSYAQFVVTSIFLCWEIDCVFHFMGVAATQILAFGLTLRKKEIMSRRCYQGFYAGLVFVFYRYGFMPTFFEQPPSSLFDPRFKVFFMALLTFMIRRQGVDRFTTWLIGPALTEVISRQLGIFS